MKRRTLAWVPAAGMLSSLVTRLACTQIRSPAELAVRAGPDIDAVEGFAVGDVMIVAHHEWMSGHAADRGGRK